MNAFFDVFVALLLALIIGIPVVTLFEKAKKEMDEEERGDKDVFLE